MDPQATPPPQDQPAPGAGSNAAADLIRQKLAHLYQQEPNARTELRESVAAGPARSKHQQYMYDLSVSGKSLAEIQAAWHAYYIGLTDQEKYEVWQEFYNAHPNTPAPAPNPATPMIAHFIQPGSGPDVLTLPTPGGVQANELEPIRPAGTPPQTVQAAGSPTGGPLDGAGSVFGSIPLATTQHPVGIGKHIPKHLPKHLPKNVHRKAAKKVARHSAKAKHHATQAAHLAISQLGNAKEQLATAKDHLGRLKPPAGGPDQQTVGELHERIIAKASRRAALTPKHHLKALGFGLTMGTLVVLILLFSFFNERFVAPFITPSRSVSATPIIIDPNKPVAVGTEPKVIIPKINVEVPVVYGLGTIEEKSIQNALEGGVVHYDTTSMPGEKGNVIIFGHSSNNILNKGKYKFAFVLLSRMEAGDLFMLQKDGKQYVYKVFSKRVVKPEEVNILNESPRTAMATLITCDPPGTSINRLLIEAEQISPDPAGNGASTAKEAPQNEQPKVVPGNAPSLFDRIRNWF